MSKHYWVAAVAAMFSSLVYGQNLEQIGSQPPVSLTGGLSATASFYGATGIQNRRAPFSYILTGSPTLNFYNSISIPFFFTYSEQERVFRQPYNQFGFSPYYKWITLYAGYRNLNYSEFTLGGHTFLGGGFDLHPGIFHFGFIYGRFNRATPVDTTSASFQPYTYANWGYAARIGVGKGANFLDFSFLRARDDSSSVHPDSAFAGKVNPAQNFVLGMKGQVKFLDHFIFSLEAATSLYNSNLFNHSVLSDSAKSVYTRFLGKMIATNSSTQDYNALLSALTYQDKTFAVRLQYRRVDPGYKSMGAYFFNNDVENITLAPSFHLFHNKFRFGGSIGYQHDNLNKQKVTTSSRLIGSANLSAEFNQHFGVDMSYTNYANTQRHQVILVKDTFRLAQVSQNFSFTPHYIHASQDRIHAVIFSANYNLFSSVDKSINSQMDTKSYNLFLNYQLTLVPDNLTLTSNLNYMDVKASNIEEGNYGITLGASKGFLKNKLTAGWNGSFLKGISANSKGLILNQSISINYRISKHHSFGFNASYINNRSQVTILNPVYSEWRGDLGYRFIF